MNPMAQVPTLECTEDDGACTLVAVAGRSSSTSRSGSASRRCLPADPYLRARARQLAEIVNSGIQPLQNLPTD